MPNNLTANLRNHIGMHSPTSLSGTYVQLLIMEKPNQPITKQDPKSLKTSTHPQDSLLKLNWASTEQKSFLSDFDCGMVVDVRRSGQNI